MRIHGARRSRTRSARAVGAAALACAVLAACNPPSNPTETLVAERLAPSEAAAPVGKTASAPTKASTTSSAPATAPATSTTVTPTVTAGPTTTVAAIVNEMQPATSPGTTAKDAAGATAKATGGTSTTVARTTTSAAGAAPSTSSAAPTTPPATGPVVTAPPTTSGGSGSSACPSGVCAPAGAPAGWRRVFVDEFATDVPVGSFPSAVSSRWKVYEDGWKDTSRKGTYMPSRVLSVQGGLLDYHLRTENGARLVSAPMPKIPGAADNGLLEARYEMRFRADTMPGYKLAALLWPTSGNWPNDGEIDFPEGDFGVDMFAFMHRQGATSGSDQDYYQVNANWNTWHTAVIERTSSAISFFLDGELIGRSTSRLPSTPMQWVLQAETTLSGDTPASTSGHFQIDWVAVSVPA